MTRLATVGKKAKNKLSTSVLGGLAVNDVYEVRGNWHERLLVVHDLAKSYKKLNVNPFTSGNHLFRRTMGEVGNVHHAKPSGSSTNSPLAL